MKLSPEKLPAQTALLRAIIALAVLTIAFTGCSRQAYRLKADRDAYRLLKSRQFDARWEVPNRTVEPNPQSRLADLNNPDCGPVPPDDPASKCYMRKPYHSRKPVEFWDERGELEAVDDQHWIKHLPINDAGVVVVDKQLSVDLALMNSREFQTQVEGIYIQALGLSSNRFEYMLNWFGGSTGSFDATGDGFNAERDLTETNQLGFTRSLATGGQFAANIANSFAWQLGGSGSSNFGAGNLVFSLTQPLLRGAFRHVRTESLTQSERDLLYAVREFARFRRQFYLDTVSRYLDLLNQAQGIRIEEENIKILELNLDEYDALYQQEKVSIIQVDQVRQRYQSGQLSLIRSRQNFQTALDGFKFQLGLPARIEIKLDESILKSFQLNSPAVDKLQQDVEDLEQSIMEYLPPEEAPAGFLDDVAVKLASYSAALTRAKSQVDAELNLWLKQLETSKPDADASAEMSIDYRQQIQLSNRIKADLLDLDELISDAEKEISVADDGQVDQPKPDEAQGSDDESETVLRWKRIQYQIAKPGGLKDRISSLFAMQTQIRIFLIKIKPLVVDEPTAVQIALENRLDLMNSRAAVVDSFRAVEISADQLQSDLTVSASADLRTDPTRDNAFRFDGDENRYNIGIELDGPLNRLDQRNSYRIAQIAYQRQRRAYMADEDSIVNGVRLNIRQLRTNLLNFQIARQQLITATRQVEQTQFTLRSADSSDLSLTQNLLEALQDLRDARNNLISSWIQYEISRISLFVDLELLNMDANGVWTNDRENIDDTSTSGRPGFEDAPIDESGAGDSGAPGGPDSSRESIDLPRPSPAESESPILDGPLTDARLGRRGRPRGLLDVR